VLWYQLLAASALEGKFLGAWRRSGACIARPTREDTGSYHDRGERREVRAWAPRSAKRFPFQGTSLTRSLAGQALATEHPPGEGS
jgi:hypothetical protein